MGLIITVIWLSWYSLPFLTVLLKKWTYSQFITKLFSSLTTYEMVDIFHQRFKNFEPMCLENAMFWQHKMSILTFSQLDIHDKWEYLFYCWCYFWLCIQCFEWCTGKLADIFYFCTSNEMLWKLPHQNRWKNQKNKKITMLDKLARPNL